MSQIRKKREIRDKGNITLDAKNYTVNTVYLCSNGNTIQPTKLKPILQKALYKIILKNNANDSLIEISANSLRKMKKFFKKNKNSFYQITDKLIIEKTEFLNLRHIALGE